MKENMKRSLSYLIIMTLLILPWKQLVSGAVNGQSADSVTVYSSPEFFDISGIWANEYNKSGGKIRISLLAGKPGSIHLDAVSIGIISNEYLPAFTDKSIWKIAVGRDVIVPVINSRNPFLSEIMEKGISQEALAQFLIDKDNQSWDKLLKIEQKTPAHFYFVSDAPLIKIIKSFTKIENSEIAGQKTGDEKEIISAIQKDLFGIGFVRMVNVVDFNNQKIAENIRLLPLDRNNNGTLDYNENFYEDLNLFSRGVWIGKYPKSLFSNIYSVSNGQPENDAAKDFLKWVLGEGQKYLYSTGYSDLIVAERQSAIDKINNPVINPERSTAGISPILGVAIILVALGMFIFLADMLIRFIQGRGTAPVKVAGLQHSLNEESMLIPKGIFFDRTHTWAFMEQNGLVKIGIDDFLQHITGPLTRIKVKNPGEKIRKGDQMMTIIRNGKQLNLYSPVTGTIKEINRNLDADASILNSSPYNLGWVYRIEPSNWIKEIQLLFMWDKYSGWMKSEFGRVKDFLAMVLSADNEKYSRVVLQDGGELVDSTLADLGPEIWDDFQTKFIDASR